MRVAQLTLEEQEKIRDLRSQRRRFYEAGTQLGDLTRSIARKHFSLPSRPFSHEKLTVDQDGKHIILE